MFGLTPAEARVAEEVLDGRRPAQAAQHANVTIYTVRTYLKRLYAKTGTHTQASLLRVLLKAME
jgi:DNA-binding CsgD family transcriptional regulator